MGQACFFDLQIAFITLAHAKLFDKSGKKWFWGDGEETIWLILNRLVGIFICTCKNLGEIWSENLRNTVITTRSTFFLFCLKDWKKVNKISK